MDVDILNVKVKECCQNQITRGTTVDYDNSCAKQDLKMMGGEHKRVTVKVSGLAYETRVTAE